MNNIPSSINGWEKDLVAQYYIDDLRWNLTPLKKGSKAPIYGGDKRYVIDREELLAHLSNGANFGLFPAGTHGVLDMDSKQDDGKSVDKFLAQSGPKVQAIPRERTAGGVHLHLHIKDLADVIRKFPNVGKLINKRVGLKVAGELFFGGKGYVVLAPSIHENGSVYHWEVTGDIPEWTWQELELTFGEFVPDKREKIDEQTRARKWKGDLRTLDIVGLAQEMEWYYGQDAKKPEMHIVACPWASDHTDGKVMASVFSGNGDNWPGFNCFHLHCAGRGILDFLDAAESDRPGIVDKHCSAKWKYEGKGSKDKRGRTQVILPGDGRENDDFVDDVAESLKNKEFWFPHGPDIVRVAEEVKSRITPEGEVETCERVQLRQVTAAIAESTLGTFVATGVIRTVEMPDGRKEQVFVNRSIPAAVAKMLMISPRLSEALPKIDRLLDIPIPIPIGNKKWILPKRGYKRELRILVDQDLKLLEMPVSDALELLADIVKDFPFADDDEGQSRCHWYARLLTPMCRGIMGWDARLPMWVFMANRPGAGKDYLNGVAQTLYYGYAFEDSAIAPNNSEETEKRITSAHAAGRRSLTFCESAGSIPRRPSLNCGHHQYGTSLSPSWVQ
jgi:hypothetical protein